MATFLDLPGEIRNRIYALIYRERMVQVSRSHPQKRRQKEQKRIVSTNGEPDLPRYQLWGSLASPKPHQKLWLSTALLHTCHQISEEAVPFLYANVILIFDSMVTTNKFLNTASPQGIKCVRSLWLEHQGYGEPQLQDLRVWKIRHDQKWMQTCKRITTNMTALERLRVDLKIRDWPTQLHSAASWAKPVLALKTDHLLHVTINLQHKAFTPERLAAASVALAKIITTGHMRKEKQGERTVGNRNTHLGWMSTKGGVQQLKKIPKATKVLVIKFDMPFWNQKGTFIHARDQGFPSSGEALST